MKKIISAFFSMVLFVYLIIICAVMPFVVVLSPIIPYLMTGNGNWLFLFIITIPAGVAMILSIFHILATSVIDRVRFVFISGAK